MRINLPCSADTPVFFRSYTDGSLQPAHTLRILVPADVPPGVHFPPQNRRSWPLNAPPKAGRRERVFFPSQQTLEAIPDEFYTLSTEARADQGMKKQWTPCARGLRETPEKRFLGSPSARRCDRLRA